MRQRDALVVPDGTPHTPGPPVPRGCGKDTLALWAPAIPLPPPWLWAPRSPHALCSRVTQHSTQHTLRARTWHQQAECCTRR